MVLWPLLADVTRGLDARARKASPHGTGRAVDFRASTNPAVSGGAFEVVRLSDLTDRGHARTRQSQDRLGDGLYRSKKAYARDGETPFARSS